MFVEAKSPDDKSEGNGTAVKASASREKKMSMRTRSMDVDQEIRPIAQEVVRCICDDKSSNNKSLLSRLRNFTDRLSMSFDTKEQTSKPGKIPKSLCKSNSVANSPNTTGTRRHNFTAICKKCNLVKVKDRDSRIAELSNIDKRFLTVSGVANIGN